MENFIVFALYKNRIAQFRDKNLRRFSVNFKKKYAHYNLNSNSQVNIMGFKPKACKLKNDTDWFHLKSLLKRQQISVPS